MTLQSWQNHIRLGILLGTCSLAIIGCDRSEKAEQHDTQNTQDASSSNTASLQCDDATAQEALINSITTTLQQQAQTLASSQNPDFSTDTLTNHLQNLIVEIQNPHSLQNASSSQDSMTCQASLVLTIPSENLYQANQMYLAHQQPNLQSRLSDTNIRLNGNMLVDGQFTYVINNQNNQTQAKIAGQPDILNIVSDIIANATLASTLAQPDNRPIATTHSKKINKPKPPVVKNTEPSLEELNIDPNQYSQQLNENQTEPKVNTLENKEKTTSTSEQLATKETAKEVVKETGNTQKSNKEIAPQLKSPSSEDIEVVIIENPNETY